MNSLTEAKEALERIERSKGWDETNLNDFAIVENLFKQVDKMEIALDWYGEQAEAIARHMDEKRDLAVMACVTALALDKGDRARIVDGVERCPVCEGIDQPGLIHNARAPYCSEWVS